MNEKNIDTRQFKNILGQAAWAGQGDTMPPLDAPGLPDDEQIALVANGQADQLADAERARVLKQIATHPELAQLVREVHDLNLDRSADANDKSAQPYHGPAVIGRISPGILRVGWVAAACLTLFLGSWRMFDPPVTQTATTGTVETYQADPQNDNPYWQQLSQQQQVDRQVSDRLRDYALFASATACLILSIPVVLRVIKK